MGSAPKVRVKSLRDSYSGWGASKGQNTFLAFWSDSACCVSVAPILPSPPRLNSRSRKIWRRTSSSWPSSSHQPCSTIHSGLLSSVTNSHWDHEKERKTWRTWRCRWRGRQQLCGTWAAGSRAPRPRGAGSSCRARRQQTETSSASAPRPWEAQWSRWCRCTTSGRCCRWSSSGWSWGRRRSPRWGLARSASPLSRRNRFSQRPPLGTAVWWLLLKPGSIYIAPSRK